MDKDKHTPSSPEKEQAFSSDETQRFHMPDSAALSETPAAPADSAEQDPLDLEQIIRETQADIQPEAPAPLPDDPALLDDQYSDDPELEGIASTGDDLPAAEASPEPDLSGAAISLDELLRDVSEITGPAQTPVTAEDAAAADSQPEAPAEEIPAEELSVDELLRDIASVENMTPPTIPNAMEQTRELSLEEVLSQTSSGAGTAAAPASPAADATRILPTIPPEEVPAGGEPESAHEPLEPAGDAPVLDDVAEIDASLQKILDDGAMPPLTDSETGMPRLADEDPVQPEVPEEEELPKRRPLRKDAYGFFGIPHIMATMIWAVIILVIGVTLGRVLWLCAADVLAFGRGDQEIPITITQQDKLEDVSQKLGDKGLIKYPKLFEIYVDFADKWDQISVGTFTLNTHMDYMALVNSMNTYSDSREVVEVVIPEGYTSAQIFRLLEAENVCSEKALKEWAANGELDEYWFLKDVKRGTENALEGFLFPDTYKFYTNDEPKRVLEKFLDNFEYRFDEMHITSIDELNQRLAAIMADNGYDEAYIEEHKLTVYEVVTVASLIEKETANTLESYTISSVIYNRLYDWGDTPPFLNIDAAIIYALGEHKDELTVEDLQIDSPYNTYLHTGLTPGAICNPGLYSLNAALDPDDTDYYYYAMDPDTGAHHFSRTEEGHNEFLESLEDND